MRIFAPIECKYIILFVLNFFFFLTIELVDEYTSCFFFFLPSPFALRRWISYSIIYFIIVDNSMYMCKRQNLILWRAAKVRAADENVWKPSGGLSRVEGWGEGTNHFNHRYSGVHRARRDRVRNSGRARFLNLLPASELGAAQLPRGRGVRAILYGDLMRTGVRRRAIVLKTFFFFLFLFYTRQRIMKNNSSRISSYIFF